MTKGHFDIKVQASVSMSSLYRDTPMASSGHVHAPQHTCVCLEGGDNRVNMYPGKISIPFVNQVNNSERCSIGK